MPRYEHLALCGLLALSVGCGDNDTGGGAADMTQAQDIGAGGDDGPVTEPDLAMPDLTPPPDMAMAPLPTLATVSPASISSAGGSTMVLTGSNFQSGAQVLFGDTPGTEVTGSGGQLTVKAPPRLGKLGLTDVTVINPDGQRVTLSGQLRVFASSMEYPARLWTVGTDPRAIAVVDLNGDKKPDLISANSIGRNISVLLAGADGEWGERRDFAAGTAAQALSVGDVNGDGKPDVVVAELLAAATKVYLLRNDGNGAFGAPQEILVGGSSGVPLLQDFTKDGKADLVVLNTGMGSTKLSVLINDGNGNFPTSKSVTVAQNPVALVAGNFDKDAQNNIDLAVLSRDDVTAGNNFVGVMFGDGAGNFGARVDKAVQRGASALATGDIDGDGDLDLVASNFLDKSVSVLSNDGAGAFSTVKHTILSEGLPAAQRPSPNGVTLVDLNGDKKLDLVATAAVSMQVMLNDGNGNLLPNVTYQAVGPTAPVAADIDGDAQPELFALLRATSQVVRLRSDRTGVLQAVRRMGEARIPVSAVVADVNADGRADLVTANSSIAEWGVDIFTGKADGTYNTVVKLDPGCFDPVSVAVADINKDNKVDIVTLCATADPTVTYFLNDGNGAFPTAKSIAVGIEEVGYMLVRDLNGDQLPEILFTRPYADTLVVLPNMGSGNFGAEATYSTGGEPRGIAVGDLDKDGKPDLVVAAAGANQLSVFRSSGGNPYVVIPVPVGTRPTYPLIADVNGDNMADLLAVNTDSDNVTLSLNQVNAQSFAAPSAVSVGAKPVHAALADTNADGVSDLVVVNSDNTLPGGNSVSVLLGNGTSFGNRRDFLVGNLPRWVVPVDLSGDGLPDLVTTLPDNDALSVQLNVSR